MRFLKLCLFSLFVFISGVVPAAAISLPGAPAPAATDKPADATAADKKKDEFGRDTPRSMVSGFLDAIAAQDYDKAAVFLNLSSLPKSQQKSQGPVLAKQLQNLLDQSGWVKPRNTVSDDPMGDTEDDLPPEDEKIGGIRTAQKVYPVLAEHITPKNQPPYWVISSDTIIEIPSLEKQARGSLLNRYLPSSLQNTQVEGVPLGHWLALIVIMLFSYMTVWSFSGLLISLICHLKHKVSNKKPEKQLIHAFVQPLQLIVAVFIAFMVVRLAGVSLLARQVFSQFSQGVIWVAFAWIIWRLIDVFANVLRRKLMEGGQYGVLSIVVLVRRAAKICLFIIVAISVLDNFGFQVTTWLAALGIGGIALALGAQKTVENFVGSLTLIADRPIAIGDLCKFGTTKGTVEDIGMRSTRVRTQDRTLVSIPNGDFASMQIENFTRRDKFFYGPVIGVRYETTPDQMRYLLIELRALLYAHPKVENKTLRVNFTEFAASSLNIEIGCYITAANNDEATDIKEDLNLRVMEIIDKAGTGMAFPSQTVYFAKDTPPQKIKTEAAHAKLKEWEAKGQFQLADFNEDEINALQNTIDYPPKTKK